jgi:hypothetical protein
MIPALEKFIADKFNQMPMPVRIFTYLFILFLFAYLMLVPKFINGEFFYKSEHGGTIPCRGGDIKMFVDGRCFKFKANEDGYWSIPIVSKLPVPVQARFYHIDADEWFPVTFTPGNYWLSNFFKVEISDTPPKIILISQKSTFDSIKLALRNILNLQSSTALAGMLKLPSDIDSDQLDGIDQESVSDVVIDIIIKNTEISRDELRREFPFPSRLKYRQIISIIFEIEKKFKLRIPDEHWNYLNNIGELIDYVTNRVIITKSKKYEDYYKSGSMPVYPSPDTINRPVFKR